MVDADADARRRLVIAVRILFVAVAAVLGIAVAAVWIALASADVRAEEVAARVAPQVFAQLAADSRKQRVENSRAVLVAANDALAERGLPMVADPGPTANAEQIGAAASSAQVLSVLPREIAERLRDQITGDVLVLPQPDGTIVQPPGPGAVQPGAPTGTAPAPGGTSTAPSSTRRPAPAGPAAPGPGGGGQPAPNDGGGLLPNLIPIPRLLQPLLSA